MANSLSGIYTLQSFKLIPFIFPSILIGVPLGSFIIHRMPPETFRRICMSFDAWIVGFGLSSVLRDLKIIPGSSAYLVMAAVVAIDLVLLYRFFQMRRAADVRSPAGIVA